MTVRTIGALVALTTVFLAAAPREASAQGFHLNRFEPSDRGSEWFVLESLDFRGHLRPAAGIVGEWAHKPLVIEGPDGEERGSVVDNQVFAHLGISLNLWERLRASLSLPIGFGISGDDASVGGGTVAGPDSSAALGDLRLGADALLVGEYEGPFRAALGLRLFLPTGDAAAYTGDDSARLSPRVTAAGDIDMFTYGGSFGLMFRDSDAFSNDAVGSEVSFALAAGVRTLEKRLVVGPELYTSTVISDGDAFFSKEGTPVEGLLGAHYTFIDDFRAGAGIGTGLTQGLGSPRARVALSIEWVPASKERVAAAPPPPPDTDGDGIYDSVDACPDVPGVPNEDASKHGCPPESDRDGDGIVDGQDACPDEAGVPNDDPAKHGCPLPGDRDGDGVVDPEDACPDEPGVRTEDPATNGCPPPNPDRDGDGILNEPDACPDEAGPANEDPKKNGCPVARIVEGQIVIIQQVQFQTNSAKIRPESDVVLNAVFAILTEHAEVKKVRVEGHTDSRGGKYLNKILSDRRAKSVVDWLVKKGIAKERLISKGVGLETPIATNDTAEGRQINRRVEFHIVERDKPAPKDDPKSKSDSNTNIESNL